MWPFVTTAARYADAVPWEYLQVLGRAVGRGGGRPAARAAGRDGRGAEPSRTPDARARLGNSPLFAVPETTTDAAGLLPDAAVTPIRDWLATLAADKASRQAVVMQTLDGAIGSLDRPDASRRGSAAEPIFLHRAAVERRQGVVREASRTMAVQTA